MPLPNFPFAISNMMQGLAFWIGHRHSLFAGHKLPEAALVVEASNLVNAKLYDRFLMFNEIEYSKLTKNRTSVILKNHSRADMVITLKSKNKSDEDFNFQQLSLFVVEFKRGGSSLINFDLQKLAEIKRLNKRIRPLLIIVYESSFPKDYIGVDNKAKQRLFSIPDTKFNYKVRRVCRAAASISERKRESVHYVCALEVL